VWEQGGRGKSGRGGGWEKGEEKEEGVISRIVTWSALSFSALA